jgi:putative nucleotidyltransferase with HDIG domain
MIYEQAKNFDEKLEFTRLLGLSRWITLGFVVTGLLLLNVLKVPLSKLYFVVYAVKFGAILALIAIVPSQRSYSRFVQTRFGYYVFDTFLMAMVAYLVGGAEWVGFAAMLFVITHSNLILPTRQGLAITALAVAAYGSVLLLEGLKILPHQSLFLRSASYAPAFLPATFLGVSVILVSLSLIVSRYSRQLRLKSHEFKAVNDRLKLLNEEVTAKNLSLTLSQKEQVVVNERLKQQNEDLSKSQHVILTLATAVESKDSYTAGHSLRVAQYALNLAKELKLMPDELNRIKNGSILHDVGKINISDLVLRKPGPLTEEEFAVMKGHPVTGEKICRPLHFARPYLDIIRHHHERIDGRGYPDGLKGDEISLQARIVAIADAFDAMTSDRSYRAAMTPDIACARLREYAGLQWDADLVETFVKMIKRGLATTDPMAILESHERQFFN